MIGGLGGTGCDDNSAPDIEKLLLYYSSKILYSEVSLIIYYSARSRCKKINKYFVLIESLHSGWLNLEDWDGQGM